MGKIYLLAVNWDKLKIASRNESRYIWLHTTRREQKQVMQNIINKTNNED